MHVLKQILKKPVPLFISAGFVFACALLIMSLYATDSPALKIFSSANTIRLRATRTILRSGPGPMYDQLAVLPRNQRLTVFQRAHGWLQVRIGARGDKGWVAGWHLNNENTSGTPDRMAEATIVLDAGHGGSDPGSLAVDGTTDPRYFEKTYTLKTVRQIRDALASTGARVILTRNSDRLLWPLSKITDISKRYHADAFISIHYDNFEVANAASGVTEYYYHRDTSNSYELANTIKNHFTNLPIANRGAQFGDFYVIRESYLPSVLLEMGYLNNTSDFQYIQSDSYRQTVANDLRNALEDWFNNVQPKLKKTE